MTTARDILKTVTGADKRFAHSLAQKPEPPGEEPDPALIRAVERIRKAAEQGFAHAQFSIAERICLGKGVKVDELNSIEWLTRAPIRSSPTTRGATPSSTRTWGESGKSSTS